MDWPGGTDPGMQNNPSDVTSVSLSPALPLGKGGFQSDLLRQPLALQAVERDGLCTGWSVLPVLQV